MPNSLTPKIGKGKLVGMLTITWLTGLIGLGNLLFLWKDKGLRNRAIIALIASQVMILPMFLTPQTFIIKYPILFGLAMWMSRDAVIGYNKYRAPSSVE